MGTRILGLDLPPNNRMDLRRSEIQQIRSFTALSLVGHFVNPLVCKCFETLEVDLLRPDIETLFGW
jgi:hypothetical protein